ncbi:MAG TPA: helix-turn-helix domain-containing protein [Thermoanaerobaculia bacterium]|nr:helix-turn-helix domain-containing protein [Thermoanaerobaculia bacterium]
MTRLLLVGAAETRTLLRALLAEPFDVLEADGAADAAAKLAEGGVHAVVVAPSSRQNGELAHLAAVAESAGLPAPLALFESWIASLPEDVSLRDVQASVEKALVVRALAASSGVGARAARKLGLSRSDLAYKMRRLGISRPNVANLKRA